MGNNVHKKSSEKITRIYVLSFGSLFKSLDAEDGHAAYHFKIRWRR